MYYPKFTISNQILRNIGTIEAAREVIDSAPLIPAYERKFRDEAMARIVHHGTHIEGNKLDFEEAEQVLAGRDVTGRERDVQEVINYRKVVEFIGEYQKSSQSVRALKRTNIKNLRQRASASEQNDNVKSKNEIDEEVVWKLHAFTVYKILPSSKMGKYRKTQVVVKNNQTGEVTFRPPSAKEVKRQMNEFFVWLNNQHSNEIHPVLRAGIVHYELARIHPFVDGNGRVARALSMLVLFREDYDIRRFFSLEEYFDSDPENYYKSLQSVEKRSGDLSEWLEYFSKGLAIELTKIKEKIQKLSVDVALKEKLGGQVALTERQIKIIEYLQKVGFLQNKAFDSLFPFVSEDTILRELKDLMKKKIIKKTGKTKAARYIMR